VQVPLSEFVFDCRKCTNRDLLRFSSIICVVISTCSPCACQHANSAQRNDGLTITEILYYSTTVLQ
jgi:hypothetical protein